MKKKNSKSTVTTEVEEYLQEIYRPRPQQTPSRVPSWFDLAFVLFALLAFCALLWACYSIIAPWKTL